MVHQWVSCAVEHAARQQRSLHSASPPWDQCLCLQFDDTVSGRVLTHLRPARTIRDAQLSSLLQRFPILQSIDVSGCTRLTGAWLRDIEHHTTIK
jgi:hypothetical protein